MEEGLIQLLFIGFFIFISVVDAIAKKKKKENERREAPLGRNEPLPEYERREASPGPGRREPLSEYTRAHGTTYGDEEDEESFESSEPMVPDELWEEIAQLARGQRSEVELEPVDEPVPVPVPVDDGRMGRMGRASAGLGKYERPLSYDERALARQRQGKPLVPDRPERTLAPVPGSGGTVPKRGARHWLSSEGSGAAALRRAVVIREVLGPPVAVRSDSAPFGE